MIIPKIPSDVKKAITQDWANAIGDLGIYKPLRLYNRIHSAVIGIELSILSANREYRPYFQIISLTAIEQRNTIFLAPVVDMYLRTRNGTNDDIEFRFHEQKYQEAAKRIKEQALLTFSVNHGPEDTLKAIFKYLEFGRMFIAFDIPFTQIEMIIHLAILLEDQSKTEYYLSKVEKLISSFDQDRLAYFAGDIDAWRKGIFSLSKAELNSRVKENIKKYKLENLRSPS